MDTVSLQDVVNALLKWRGNVRAAAEELGMRRKNLYDRIQRADLDLEAFRRTGSEVRSFSRRVMSRVTPVPRDMSPETREGLAVPESQRGPYRGRRGPPTVGDMEQVLSPAADAPIRTARPKRTQIRLLPEQQDQLREAKFDFAARFRIETDENTILAQFFEEEFHSWKARKLSENGRKESKK